MDILRYPGHIEARLLVSKLQEEWDSPVLVYLDSKKAQRQSQSYCTNFLQKWSNPTSCQSHRSTVPGFARPLSQTLAFVRSRHRASTTFPFFSFETYACVASQYSAEPTTTKMHVQTKRLTSGCRQRFLRLVSPIPRKFSSFILSSSVSAHFIRYSSSRFSSARAFSISGTVREQ